MKLKPSSVFDSHSGRTVPLSEVESLFVEKATKVIDDLIVRELNLRVANLEGGELEK